MEGLDVTNNKETKKQRRLNKLDITKHNVNTCEGGIERASEVSRSGAYNALCHAVLIRIRIRNSV